MNWKHIIVERWPEWVATYLMLGIGVVFYTNPVLFDQPLYMGYHLLFGEHPSANLGWWMLLFGMLRLIGLVVNGMAQRVTPWLRWSSAMAGAFIWGGIIFAHAVSPVLGVALLIYPIFLVGELVCVKRSSYDIGEAYATT